MQTTDVAENGATPRWRAWCAFAISVAALGIAWGIVLPQSSQIPAQRSYEEWLDQNRLDPSAMFYTEVEPLAPILRRIE